MTKLKIFSQIVNFLAFFIFSAFTLSANTVTVQTAAGGNWLSSGTVTTGWNNVGYSTTGWVTPSLATTCNDTQVGMLPGVPKVWGPTSGGGIGDNPTKTIPVPTTTSSSTCYFRYAFNLDGLTNAALNLNIIGDDFVKVYLNGVQIGATTDWTNQITLTSIQNLKCGANVLAFEVQDVGACHYLAVFGSMTGNSGTAVINGVTPVCVGTSTTLSTTGGGTYLWSTNATSSSITVSPSTGTNYAVTVTTPAGCKMIGTKLIKVNAAPSVTIGTFPTVTCNKFSQPVVSQSLSVPSASGYTYLWSTGSTAQNLVNAISPSNPFSVTVTTALGCKTVRTISYTNPCLASINPNSGSNSNIDNSDIISKQEFRVFPNPIKDELNIQLDIKDSEAGEVILTNMFGRIIERQIATGSTIQLNTSQLPKGIYLVTLIKDGALISSQKVIKQD